MKIRVSDLHKIIREELERLDDAKLPRDLKRQRRRGQKYTPKAQFKKYTPSDDAVDPRTVRGPGSGMAVSGSPSTNWRAALAAQELKDVDWSQFPIELLQNRILPHAIASAKTDATYQQAVHDILDAIESKSKSPHKGASPYKDEEPVVISRTVTTGPETTEEGLMREDESTGTLEVVDRNGKFVLQDQATGKPVAVDIGTWSRDEFVKLFKKANPHEISVRVGTKEWVKDGDYSTRKFLRLIDMLNPRQAQTFKVVKGQPDLSNFGSPSQFDAWPA